MACEGFSLRSPNLKMSYLFPCILRCIIWVVTKKHDRVAGETCLIGDFFSVSFVPFWKITADHTVSGVILQKDVSGLVR